MCSIHIIGFNKTILVQNAYLSREQHRLTQLSSALHGATAELLNSKTAGQPERELVAAPRPAGVLSRDLIDCDIRPIH